MSKKNKQQKNEADVTVEEITVEETVDLDVEEKPKKTESSISK